MRPGSRCSLRGPSQPGGGKELSNSDLIHPVFHALAEQTGIPERDCTKLITFVPDRPGYDRRYALDTEKACGYLHWIAGTPVMEAAPTPVSWFLHRLPNEEAPSHGGELRA